MDMLDPTSPTDGAHATDTIEQGYTLSANRVAGTVPGSVLTVLTEEHDYLNKFLALLKRR
jgi:hypothetical protein